MRMRQLLITTIAASALTIALAQAADARPHRTGGGNRGESGQPAECYGIPWCGCWLRLHKGIADKAANLSSWWRHYGQRVSGPVVGAVAVMHGHVGEVVGVDANGNPIVISGNHNNGVGTSVYPKRRVVEYRM